MADIDDELDAAMMEDENEEELTQEDLDDDGGTNEDNIKPHSVENTDEENGQEDVQDGEDEGDETGEDNEENDEMDSSIDIQRAESLENLKFIQGLDEGKSRQHEQFRRSHFDKNVIKRCMMQVIEDCSGGDRRAPTVHNNLSIVMSGLAKKFVGELTEQALELMRNQGDDGPIRPHHLREVHRKYYKRHPLARGRQRHRLLR